MYSVGSLLLGVFLTIVGIVLMFVLIRSWWRDSTFTPMSFVVGGILFFFLAFQAVLLCGAVTIKSMGWWPLSPTIYRSLRRTVSKSWIASAKNGRWWAITSTWPIFRDILLLR